MKHAPNMTRLATLVLTVSLVGCGQSQQASGQSGDSGSSAKVENSVTFTCAEVPADGFTLSYTEATRHKMSTASKQYLMMSVKMANYDRQGGSYHPNAKGDQRRVLLAFSAPSGEEVTPGRYSPDAKMGEGRYLSIGIEGSEGSCGLGNGTEGFGEITHIDDSTVSGRVSVKDAEGTSIEATFSTTYEISRY